MGAQRALPAEVAQSLRRAFAAERDARLPHLRQQADPEQARHAAHALASSAWVVGEHEISLLARRVEDDLDPSDVSALTEALEGYLP